MRGLLWQSENENTGIVFDRPLLELKRSCLGIANVIFTSQVLLD